MATERSAHQQWADAQIETLIELGLNPIDAERATQEVLDRLPPGADPATHIFPANELWQEPSEQQQDSAAAWMENVEPKYKRLLSAREEAE